MAASFSMLLRERRLGLIRTEEKGMGVGRLWRRAGLLLCCLLLLIPGSALAQESPRPTEEPRELATDLTAVCSFLGVKSPKSWRLAMTDGRTTAARELGEGESLTVRAPSDMGTLTLRLCQLKSAFLLLQRGETGLPLRMRIFRTGAMALRVPLVSGCRAVTICPWAGPCGLRSSASLARAPCLRGRTGCCRRRTR